MSPSIVRYCPVRWPGDFVAAVGAVMLGTNFTGCSRHVVLCRNYGWLSVRTDFRTELNSPFFFPLTEGRPLKALSKANPGEMCLRSERQDSLSRTPSSVDGGQWSVHREISVSDIPGRLTAGATMSGCIIQRKAALRVRNVSFFVSCCRLQVSAPRGGECD